MYVKSYEGLLTLFLSWVWDYVIKFYYRKANLKYRCLELGHTSKSNSVTREIICILKFVYFFFIILELPSFKNGWYWQFLSDLYRHGQTFSCGYVSLLSFCFYPYKFISPLLAFLIICFGYQSLFILSKARRGIHINHLMVV